MRRTLALGVVVVACAVGCGSSGSRQPAAQTVIKAGRLAMAKQHTVGFNVRVRLAVHGALKGLGPAAALLAAPVTLDLRGHTATSSSVAKAAFRFRVTVAGGSFSGQVLAPGGHTAYIQLPSLLGTGWRSFPVSSSGGRALTGGASLAKLDPASWLTDIHSSSKGGTDTLSAGLDVKKALTAILAGSGSSLSNAEQTQLAQAASAVKSDVGSVSYSSTTHLPSAFAGGLLVEVPPKLVARAHGVTELVLSVSAHLSDWGKSFTVRKPASSSPLRGLRLTGSDSRP